MKFSCRDLLKLDTRTESDTFIVIEENQKSRCVEIGRSEVVSNKKDPDYAYNLRFLYKFQEKQKIKISVYDTDSTESTTSLDLSKQALIGYSEMMISEIIKFGTNGYQTDLTNKDRKGKLGVLIVKLKIFNRYFLRQYQKLMRLPTYKCL